VIKVVSFDVWRTLLDLESFYDLIAEKLAEISNKDYEIIKEKIWLAYKEALKARLRGEFKRAVYDSAIFFANILQVRVDELFRATAIALLDNKIGDLKYLDVDQTLKELKEMKSIKIATLGNVLFWPGMITRIILEKNNILQYMDLTLFGDEIGIQKPDKEVFKLLAELTNSEIHQIIHVGDSLTSDFSGALIAGANAVLIKRDLEKDIISLSDKAHIIRDLRLLNKIVRSMT